MVERCPFCGSGRFRAGPVAAGLAYRVCEECGSAFQLEPTLDFETYYETYNPALVARLASAVAHRYESLLGRMERLAPGRSLLEVGCGNGHFIAEAGRRGWRARGVELSRAHVRACRTAGLEVAHGDLVSSQPWPGETFDAVVMIELLEHVPHPRALLGSVAERLRPGGVVFLTTPNFGSVTRRLLGGRWSVLDPEHVALASTAGLRAVFAEYGLAVLSMRSRSLYLSEYRKLFERRSGDPGGSAARTLSEQNAALRDRIEASAFLRAGKGTLNGLLGLLGLGESLEAWARKLEPPHPETA